jgi:hypothetical protein
MEEESGHQSDYALALITARCGELDLARAQLEELRGREDFHPTFAAWAAVELGDHELALDFLEQAYEARAWHLLTMITQSRLRVLQDLPRFQELLRKIGIPNKT